MLPTTPTISLYAGFSSSIVFMPGRMRLPSESSFRSVITGLRRRVQRLVPNVADHADDLFVRRLLVFDRVYARTHALAERIFVREPLACKLFVDDDDTGRAMLIARTEVAALER